LDFSIGGVIMLFPNRAKKAFRAVKKDIAIFKQNINEWIQFLNTGQRDLDMRVKMLEKRIEQLETLLYRRQL
jgi:hypothetical protein